MIATKAIIQAISNDMITMSKQKYSWIGATIGSAAGLSVVFSKGYAANSFIAGLNSAFIGGVFVGVIAGWVFLVILIGGVIGWNIGSWIISRMKGDEKDGQIIGGAIGFSTIFVTILVIALEFGGTVIKEIIIYSNIGALLGLIATKEKLGSVGDSIVAIIVLIVSVCVSGTAIIVLFEINSHIPDNFILIFAIMFVVSMTFGQFILGAISGAIGGIIFGEIFIMIRSTRFGNKTAYDGEIVKAETTVIPFLVAGAVAGAYSGSIAGEFLFNSIVVIPIDTVPIFIIPIFAVIGYIIGTSMQHFRNIGFL